MLPASIAPRIPGMPAEKVASVALSGFELQIEEACPEKSASDHCQVVSERVVVSLPAVDAALHSVAVLPLIRIEAGVNVGGLSICQSRNSAQTATPILAVLPAGGPLVSLVLQVQMGESVNLRR